MTTIRHIKGKTPLIFLPWCFAVRAAYSVVIILPLILHALAVGFLLWCAKPGRQQRGEADTVPHTAGTKQKMRNEDLAVSCVMRRTRQT